MELGESIHGRFEPLGLYAASLGTNFAPKVVVALGLDRGWRVGDPRLPQIARRGLTALIDTGSDVTRIDEALVREFGIPSQGARSSSFTGLVAETHFYDIQVVFEQALFVVGGLVSGVELRATGNYHDIILGWDILKYFDLTVSQKDQRVAMTFVGV